MAEPLPGGVNPVRYQCDVCSGYYAEVHVCCGPGRFGTVNNPPPLLSD
jgi:hypothetical protein